MAQQEKPRKRPAPPGNRKNLTLVVLAGLLLVVWGFVLGVLVGRGTVPTIIPDPAESRNQDRGAAAPDAGQTSVTTTRPPAAPATVTTKPAPPTTMSFYKELSEEVAETLPPLPPPTTLKPPAARRPDKPAPPKDRDSARKPKPDREPAPETRPDQARFELQVAAFPTRPEAEKEARRVAAKTDFRVRVVSARVKGQTWYRVRVGRFATRQEAGAAARSLKSSGVDSLLVRAVP